MPTEQRAGKASCLFAPAAAYWRLIPASDRAAARICGLVLTLALVYGLTTLIYAVTRIVQAPFALTVAVAFPSSLLVAGIVVAILLTPLQGERRDGMPSLRWLTALRIPAWITVAAIVVSALAGYLALSRFLAQQLIVTGSILALVYLLLLWVDGISRGLSDESATAGRWLEQRVGLEQRRRKQLVLPVGLFFERSLKSEARDCVLRDRQRIHVSAQPDHMRAAALAARGTMIGSQMISSSCIEKTRPEPSCGTPFVRASRSCSGAVPMTDLAIARVRRSPHSVQPSR